MPSKLERVRLVHQLNTEKAKSRELVTVDEIVQYTGWKLASVQTYIRKQWESFLIEDTKVLTEFRQRSKHIQLMFLSELTPKSSKLICKNGRVNLMVDNAELLVELGMHLTALAVKGTVGGVATRIKALKTGVIAESLERVQEIASNALQMPLSQMSMLFGILLEESEDS